MVNGPDPVHGDRYRRYGIQLRCSDGIDLTPLAQTLDLSELDIMTIRDLAGMGAGLDDSCLIAMLLLMFAAMADGSVCLQLDKIGRRRPSGRLTDPDLRGLGDGFVNRLNAGRYDRLIDRTGAGAFQPLVLDGSSGHPLLYFQRFHYHERRLKRRLDRFLARPAAAHPSLATADAILDDLYGDDAVIRKGVGGDPVVRDSYQVDAIRAAMVQPLLVISGGPGTGKTSLLANMLRALVRSGLDASRILLAAPTGRAAQRMGDALSANLATIAKPDRHDRQLSGMRASTLHRLLVFSKRLGGFVYSLRRALPADVVLVDEVSMIDLAMMDRLFQAIDPRQTRVILLGDKDQLPSVDAGAVFADLKPIEHQAGGRHFVELRNVYRAGGRLLQLARAINAGASIALDPIGFEKALQLPDGQWAFVDTDRRVEMELKLEQWCRHHYTHPPAKGVDSYVDLVGKLNRLVVENDPLAWDEHPTLQERLFAFSNQCRVLTLLRRGPQGAAWFNDRIGDHVRRLSDPDSDPDGRLFSGALLMVTRNDDARGLRNGDVGVVLRQSGGGYQVVFWRSGRVLSVPAAGVVGWDLAFAMTVHKSQGSEYADTLLVLPDDPGHRLLTREILYTAATRAARSLIVCGTAAAFYTALQRKITRHSGLIFNPPPPAR